MASATFVVAFAMVCAGCAGPQHAARPAPTSSDTVARQPAPIKCESLNFDSGVRLQYRHVRCALSMDDLTIDVSSDPPWSFSVRDARKPIQQFNEPVVEMGESGALPLLQDIDGSGTPVLLVVTGRGGTGGEPMAVWHLTRQPTRFVRAGELFGFRKFFRSTEGYFGNYAHSSAVSGTVTLYRWVDDMLAGVVVLETRAAQADVDDSSRNWVRNGDVLCALSDDDRPDGVPAQREAALTAAGIDPATAQERFCTQPWVASIY